MGLTRDNILDADDLPLEEVEVPEWGGSVYVRSMNGFERQEFDTWLMETQDDPNRTNMRGVVVCSCTTDADGVRLFTAEDAEALGKKSAEALNRVFDVAMRLNALSADAVEDIAEN
jgi:hypothetical protein